MTKSHAGKPVTISSMAVAQGDEQKDLVRFGVKRISSDRCLFIILYLST